MSSTENDYRGLIMIRTLACFIFIAVGCGRTVCDQERRERLFLECLDRTSKNIVNAGEDVDLGSAVWPCQLMAEKFSCWDEFHMPWGK